MDSRANTLIGADLSLNVCPPVRVIKRPRQGREGHPTPPAGTAVPYLPVFPNGFFNGLETFLPIGVFPGGSRPMAHLSWTPQISVYIQRNQGMKNVHCHLRLEYYLSLL